MSFLNPIMCTGVTFQITRIHMLWHILCAKVRLIHLVFWLPTHVYLAYDDCRVYVYYVSRFYFMSYSVKCYTCQAQILICEINYASVLTKR